MRLASPLLMLLAAGCAALKPGAEEALVVSEIVEMAVEAARAPFEAQRERLAVELQAAASRPDDANRLRAAVLLSTLPAPLRDDARAAALIRPLAERRPETALVHFAGLLELWLAEHQRAEQALRGQIEALRGQIETLRAEIESPPAQQRRLAEREDALRRRNLALRAGERGMVEREETLSRQLEALRESERSMSEREQALRRQVEALRESERSMIEREGRLGAKAR